MTSPETHLFHNAAFGVTESDQDGRVTYANEWMRALLGPRFKEGARLLDFVTDPESQATLAQEVSKRLAGLTGEYVIKVNAAARSMSLQIFGTPMRDSAGKVTGAVGFITRAPLDNTRDALLEIGPSPESPLAPLDAMRKVLESAFSFDCLTVAMYDKDMEYSNVLYTYFRDAGGESGRWDKHWVRLNSVQRDWILASTAEDRAIADINEFMQDPAWDSMRGNKMVVAFEKLGLRSVAGTLVKEGHLNVASVSLVSKQRGAYDADVVKELHQLPIDRCVLAAVHAVRAKQTEFRYELVRRLAKCHKINELANSFVKLLGKEYRLARAALFSVDWAGERARLQSERVSGGFKRPEAQSEIPLTEGPIAEVAKTGECVYVADLADNEFFANYLKETHGSALLWPVSYYRDGGDKLVRWIFCAVDDNVDAFSPRERDDLGEIATDIGGLLQRLTELHFMRSTFDATSDAILVVDGKHAVRRANPAAAALFKRGDPREVSGSLADYFADRNDALPFQRKASFTAEVNILGADRESIPALVTSKPLPDSIGGKVLAFEDLRPLQRLRDLSLLGRVAFEFSSQIQTPLTLASSWVLRAGGMAASSKESGGTLDQDSTAAVLDLAARSLTQLRRIQSCLDRIALYDSKGEFVPRRAIPLCLDAELQRVYKSLPESEQERIRVQSKAKGVKVDAHPEHLGFVLNTLFAFFLRDLPGADKLDVTMGKRGRQGYIACQVRRPPNRKGAKTADPKAIALSAELGLAEDGLKKIVGGYGGKFVTTRMRGDRRVAKARLTLPLRS